MEKQCPNCGANVSESQQTCKYCGSANPYYRNKFQEKTGINPNTFTKIRDSFNQTMSDPKTQKTITTAAKIFIGIVCAFILIIFLIIIISIISFPY